ncbi:MAG TPA: flagellar M-ring protein FliF C-terminal domain-containing protein [Pirellulales bacterium]|nr:flagellar M-ring protein FliF C-terminal domain-containing protein [Pirellulales bacterium]
MTPGARITAGLLLAVLVVSLGYLFNHQSSSPDGYLMGGEPVPLSQLSAIHEAFGKAKLAGYEIDADHRIRVPDAQKAVYMAALADAGALPTGFGDSMMKAITTGGPLTSHNQQLALAKVALERQLAEIVSAMRGVETASVLYNVDSEPGLSLNHAIKTATVNVKMRGSQTLEDNQVLMIRQLVAGAIGCKPTDVSVGDLTTGRTHAAGSGTTPGGVDNDYADMKEKYEKQWEAKIRDALNWIPAATVKVNVELNPEIMVEQSDDKFDKPVPFDTEENNSSTTSQSAAPGGPPGLVAQRGVQSNAPANLAASNGTKNQSETNKTRTKSAVTTSRLITKKAPLTPSRVTVSIGVPRSYYESIWRLKNPTPAGSDPKPISPQDIDALEAAEQPKIEQLVGNLLPPVHDEKVQQTTKQVTVMTFQQLPGPAIEQPTVADKATAWFVQYWSTLGTIGLGMVSLLMLRSMVRAVPAAESPRSEAAPVTTAPAGEEEDAAAVEQQDAAARLKRRAKSGPSLRDELVEIVREDPDAAANILRNWIGSAT